MLSAAVLANWDLGMFEGYEAVRHGFGKVTVWSPKGLPPLPARRTPNTFAAYKLIVRDTSCSFDWMDYAQVTAVKS
eukprot:8171287-Lingulodinium_polyedra.AAC.1